MKARNSFIWPALLFAGLLSACTAVQVEPEKPISENAIYLEARSEETPETRTQAMEAFLRQFPETGRKGAVYGSLMRDYAGLNNERKALEYAELYIDTYPEDRRTGVHNSVAWTLATHDLAIEKAVEYANLAVEEARNSESRSLQNILDTQAMATFKAGDAQRAVRIQQEALEGNETRADFLDHMSQFQYASGQKEQALGTGFRSLFYGSDEDVLDRVDSWVAEVYPDAAERRRKRGELVRSTIRTRLGEDPKPADKMYAALLLESTGIDLARAEELARQSVADLGEDVGSYTRLEALSRLARVLNTCAKHPEAIELLTARESEANFFNRAFWLELGRGYGAVGRTEDARGAFTRALILSEPSTWSSAFPASVLAAAAAAGIDAKAMRAAYDDYEMELLDFDPGAYAGSPTDRVVLAELFTGAECSPCVAADKAFDVLKEFYPRTTLAILEYHVHIPGADPMTTDHTEKRFEFYGGGGTPTVWLNGTERNGGGGPEIMTRGKFDSYRETIGDLLEKKPPVALDTQTFVDGSRVSIEVTTKGRPEKADDTRLHVALVETRVDYVGGNGIQHHAFVVRHLAHGPEGASLKWYENSSRSTVAIDLDEVEQQVRNYLDEFAANPPDRFQGFPGWSEPPDTLDRERLAVVVWLQDSETKEVYQAQYKNL